MPEETQDVITEEPSASEQETVNEEAQEQGEEGAVTSEEKETQATQEVEAVDERGVPWKNRAMELERKFGEVPDIIKRTVTEAMTAQQTPKQEQYTIEQLERFAQEQPSYRPWVEQEKAKIIQSNVVSTLQSQREEDKRQATESQIRSQSEQRIVNHPAFKDCFAKDAVGNTVWNYGNPMTQLIGNILNSPDPVTGKLVKDRPDGLSIAAEIAYGRQALSATTITQKQVSQVKKDLRKAQRQMMSTGGSRQASATAKRPIQSSLENYNKTYNKQHIQDATKEFLRASGLIQEE